jgi:threonyl-tRNA synthetase
LTDYLNNAHKGHKELGAQMELFTFKEQSPGSTFWLSQGVELRKQMQNYLLKKLGPSYLEVKTPQLLKKSLWEQSGHLAAFAENMFFVDDEHGLKPMNCPCHMLIFKEKIRSYKDLPYRIYEYGEVFRNEASGALNGLLRVRNMTIDDGHIFCTIDQIKDEVEAFMQIIKNVYSEFGFNKVSVYLSTRPENYQGDSEVWNKSESMLRELQLEEKPGEGAFYGPKVEFHLEDSLGRMWQCGTIQLDFILPERMGLKYTASSG